MIHVGRARSELTASVNFNPAFRELEWQDLHAAALQLLRQSVQVLLSEHTDGESSARGSTIWQVCNFLTLCIALVQSADILLKVKRQGHTYLWSLAQADY